ncbi:MAG: FMN-binding protein [Minisyncoccia bacterium]
MLKKIIAGAAVVVAAFLYIILGNRQPSSDAAGTTAVSDAAASSSITSSPSAGGVNPSTAGSGVSGAATLKDGTYEGPVADAVYGNLQVAAVISNGKLTAVNILEKPDAPGHTTEVSESAIPELVQEAITAQSAKVDVVSGATQDSEAFQQSLGAALESAQG